MKAPFAWDSHSDQPYQLKDREYKKSMRKKELFSLLKTFLAGIVFLPPAVLAMPLLRKRPVRSESLPGLVVDPLREPEATLEAIASLRIRRLLVRIKLWELQQLEEITAFLDRLKEQEIFFVLMQDREHIEDETLRRRSLERCFTTLSPYGSRFQVATTINRVKWGFFSVDEYLRFFKTAQQLKAEAFPQLQLIGPSVIDFEYHYTAHALFNCSGIRFDAVSSLLYVDRRGAPENLQSGCDLPCKINLLSALTMLSPRARAPLYITEANWPLSGTAPYAPTSEKECVDEDTYASYMVRYYLLALASQQIETVFWHQLVAPGYGLVDHRDGFRKRPAFFALATLTKLLENSRYIALQQHRERFEMFLQKPDGTVRIFWANGTSYSRQFTRETEFIDRDGNPFRTDRLTVTDAPVYLFEKEPE